MSVCCSSSTPPAGQVYGKSQMCDALATWFDLLKLYLFSDECRSSTECVVFGRRRKMALTDSLIFMLRDGPS
jgi:hypothetical protein